MTEARTDQGRGRSRTSGEYAGPGVVRSVTVDREHPTAGTGERADPRPPVRERSGPPRSVLRHAHPELAVLLDERYLLLEVPTLPPRLAGGRLHGHDEVRARTDMNQFHVAGLDVDVGGFGGVLSPMLQRVDEPVAIGDRSQ